MAGGASAPVCTCPHARMPALRSVDKSERQNQVLPSGERWPRYRVVQHDLGHQNILHAVRYIQVQGVIGKAVQEVLGKLGVSLRQRSNSYANTMLLEPSGRTLRTAGVKR